MKALYTKLHAKFRSTMKDQKGATMVEYALMLALIAAVCVGVVTTVGTGAKNTFTTIDGKLNPAA